MGSNRLTSSSSSPSDWQGEATTTWAVRASRTIGRDFLCDDPEESSRVTYDEVRACFLVRGVAGHLPGKGRAANPSRMVLAITNGIFAASLQTRGPSNSPWRNGWLPTIHTCSGPWMGETIQVNHQAYCVVQT